MRWAALLKGVNVGGNRKLPMADLKAVIAGLGYRDVQTLLASGNVVFDSDETDGAALEAAVEHALAAHGLATDVVVRNAADLNAVISANPFPDAAADRPSHYVVAFHRDPVPGALIDRVSDVYRGPERLAAIGRDLYVDYPDTIGDSKLPRAMATLKFPKIATARNWNTVIKLRALLG